MLMQVNHYAQSYNNFKEDMYMHYIGQRINVDPKLNDLGPERK